MRIYLKYFCFWVVIGLGACGKNDSPTTRELASVFKGSQWKGVYNPVERYLNYQGTEVSLSFAQAPQFELFSGDELKNPAAKGEFEEMSEHAYVVFHIEESHFTPFGKNGLTKAYSYSLSDDELVLSGVDGEYLLKKIEDASSDESESRLTGTQSWLCSYKNGSSLVIKKTNDRFEAIQQTFVKSIFYSGTVKALSEDDIANNPQKEAWLLTIRQSTIPQFVGYTFKLLISGGALEIKLKEYDQKENLTYEGLCSQRF